MGGFSYTFTAIIAIIGCINAVPLAFESNIESGSRITNGANATENQFPYAISLQYLSPPAQALDTRGHRCGGALVTYRLALTTASCLHDTVEGVSTVINAAEYRVFAGSILLTNDTTTGQDRIRTISNFIIHPNYTGQPAHLNDIAIVNLTTPFAVATVRPLTLPSASFEPADFTLCQVAGWGARDASQTASRELQFANKYIYNQNLCTMLYNAQVNLPNIFPSMVCAASFDILSSGCVNDNGNALVCEGTLTGLLFVHDNCRASSYPELYTRVANYTPWIMAVSASPTLFSPAASIITVVFTIARVYLKY